ncbi:MAG: hypothetical protein BWX87_02159 [Bacteroidetes bacterium ADurb.Bin123]|nr:MAG: hypothetical protein BWX87_02159 [Bacteroidetes bacterium ADurb.Bin123]
MENQAVAGTPGFGGPLLHQRAGKGGHSPGILADAGIEEHFHPLSLVAEFHVLGIRDHITLYITAVDQGSVGLCYITAFSLLVANIKEDMGLLRRRKGIAVVPHPGGGGEFCPDAVIGKHDGIITRFRNFTLLVKTGPVAAVGVLQGAGKGFQGSGGGHAYHAPYLEFMEIAETLNRGMAIVITAGLPTPKTVVGVGVGSQFRHSEGNCRGRVKKPPAVNRAYLRVHQAYSIKSGTVARSRSQEQQRCHHQKKRRSS